MSSGYARPQSLVGVWVMERVGLGGETGGCTRGLRVGVGVPGQVGSGGELGPVSE
jgi:hypothetical protein